MPKVVTQRCLEHDLNPRPTDRRPKCLTVAPPRHLHAVICECQAYALFDFVWHCAVPVLIFAYCYSRIVHTIRRQSKVVAPVGRSHDVSVATASRGDQNAAGRVEQQATSGGKLSHTELNVLKTMITIIACFIVCWTPVSLTAVLLSLTVGLFLQL